MDCTDTPLYLIGKCIILNIPKNALLEFEFVVELRSRSRSGPGQVQVRKLRN